MSDKIDGIAVGIDLGTTYSCVGIWQHDRVKITANDQGNRTPPSYVAFTESERLIGDAAKNQVAMNPQNNTVFGTKKNLDKNLCANICFISCGIFLGIKIFLFFKKFFKKKKSM